MGPTTPVLAASLAARAGIPVALLPSVSERAARTVAAVQSFGARHGAHRLTQREIAERVVWEAVLDWWEGTLERVCPPGGGA